MAEETPTPTLSDNLTDLIVTSLRHEYPWLEVGAVHAAAKAQTDLLAIQIEQHHPLIEASKARCSFMSLPPEIRIRIYELALRPEKDGDGGVRGTKAIVVGVEPNNPKTRPCFEWPDRYLRSTNWAQQPAITRINRAVREEALEIYYGSNHFISHSNISEHMDWDSVKDTIDWDLSPLTGWLSRIGPANVARIKSLELCHYEVYFKDMEEDTIEWEHFKEGWDRMTNGVGRDLPEPTVHVGFDPYYGDEKQWQPMCIMDPRWSPDGAAGSMHGDRLAYRMVDETDQW